MPYKYSTRPGCVVTIISQQRTSTLLKRVLLIKKIFLPRSFKCALERYVGQKNNRSRQQKFNRCPGQQNSKMKREARVLGTCFMCFWG